MHGQSIYSRYTPSYKPDHSLTQPEAEHWFIFHKDQLLVRTDLSSDLLPGHSERDFLCLNPSTCHYLGQLDNGKSFCTILSDPDNLPHGYALCSLRTLSDQIDPEIFMLAGRAYQILHWDAMNQFCGRCGSPTRLRNSERARKCDHCGNIIYPRISPAIIVAILRDDQILLAHNRTFRPGLYSLVAGFMEPGEEFEDTVAREVFEEVGVQVKNIRYYASQTWPFPDSLMVGFICDYDGGDIHVDGIEIEHADWFTRDTLPEIPGPTRIAGNIIQGFINQTL